MKVEYLLGVSRRVAVVRERIKPAGDGHDRLPTVIGKPTGAAGPTPSRWPRNEPGSVPGSSTLGDSCDGRDDDEDLADPGDSAAPEHLRDGPGARWHAAAAGAVSTGVRGAVVGGMVGGEAGRGERGPRSGAVTVCDVTRHGSRNAAADTVPGHRRIPGGPECSNFSQAPPEVLGTAPRPGAAATPSGESRHSARMASPSWGSPSPPIGSRRRAPTTSPPSLARMQASLLDALRRPRGDRRQGGRPQEAPGRG